MKKNILTFSFLIILFPSAFAGTCYLSSSNIIFGRYIRTNPSLNSSGTFYVTCTDSLAYTYCVMLNTNTPRTITRATGTPPTLNYQLYRDAARSNVWTNGSCVNVTKSCPFTSPCKEILYGQIPNGQTSGSGTYQGIITASLSINPSVITSQTQAYVNNGCNIAADLFTFGIYSPYSPTNLDIAQSNLHVNCNNGAPYTIGLSAGNSGNVSSRYMTNGGSHLLYNLYTTNARSTIWNATGISGIGTGATQNLSIYGRIPIHQYLPSGGYMDTIVATIAF